MMHVKPLFKPLLAAVLFIFVAAGCTHFISPYDQYAYAQTTALKVDVLNLMDKSGEQYTAHKEDIASVTSEMMKVIEYEKHRPNNGITVQMWNHMLDSTGQNGIVGRYLQSWKRDGTKGDAMIGESKQQVSEGFDLIADLESRKIKESDAPVLNFLHK